MKERIAADISGVYALATGVGSLITVLQTTTLVLGVACGAFSLYFHIKRFIRGAQAGS